MNMIYMYLYILLVYNNSGNAAAGIARDHEPSALTCGCLSLSYAGHAS